MVQTTPILNPWIVTLSLSSTYVAVLSVLILADTWLRQLMTRYLRSMGEYDTAEEWEQRLGAEI